MINAFEIREKVKQKHYKYVYISTLSDKENKMLKHDWHKVNKLFKKPLSLWKNPFRMAYFDNYSGSGRLNYYD